VYNGVWGKTPRSWGVIKTFVLKITLHYFLLFFTSSLAVSALPHPQYGTHSLLAFAPALHYIHSVVKPTVSIGPSVAPSGSHKCLRFGLLVDTVHFKGFYLLTYLITNYKLQKKLGEPDVFLAPPVILLGKQLLCRFPCPKLMIEIIARSYVRGRLLLAAMTSPTFGQWGRRPVRPWLDPPVQ